MANVRLMAKDWELVASSIKTEILRVTYQITRKKHSILRIPIQFIERNGSLDDKIADMKKAILTDYEEKKNHPDSTVQNNKPLNLIEALKNRLLEYEKEIKEFQKTIERLNDLLYFVEQASQKPDTVFDKELHRPTHEKTPLWDFDELSSEEEFKWRCIEQID